MCSHPHPHQGVSDDEMCYEDHVTTIGTEWADAAEIVVNDMVGNVSVWTEVVKSKANQIAKANPASDPGLHMGATEFVIPPNCESPRVRRYSHPARSNQGWYTGTGAERTQAGGLFPDLSGSEVQHKSTVEPMYLAYKRISTEAGRLSLMQVATAVVQALQDNTAVDAVQLMRNEWWIYVKTNADHDKLVTSSITIAGKHIQLQSEAYLSNVRSVKVTLCDLPLHCVDNSQVLEVVSQHCTLLSLVQYGTL